jgi:hypothetical protein
METKIQCLCGEVKLTLLGEPLFSVYCHCRDCQLVHGGAYLPAAMYPIGKTEITAGTPLRWKLRTTTRATCPKCGTRLFAEPPDFGIRSITAFLLPAESFKPQFHMQCQEAIAPIRDDLPHFKGYPAVFGGSDDQMPW